MSEQTVTAVADSKTIEPPYGMDYRTWFEYKAKLGKKIAEVMAAMETIPKNGYNEEDDFYFARESDINDFMRPLLFTHQLGFGIEFVERVYRDGGSIVEVKLAVTWTDLETGYFEVKHWLGTGFDKMEKGVYKAYTGGAKYYLMRNFLMSQGDTDPEYSKRKKPPTERTPDGLPIRDITEELSMQKAEPRTSSTKNTTKVQEKKAEASEETKDKPAEKQEDTDKPSQKENDTKGVDKQEKATEGRTEAVASNEAEDSPITLEQKEQFEVKLKELTAFSDSKSKKSAQEAVFASLAIKKELLAWGERVRRATANKEKMEALTEQEAEMAIKYMAAWAEARRKGGRSNA